MPSTTAFLDASLAGLAWTLNPLMLVCEHLGEGRLVELLPERPLDVPLHWQHARLGARLLDVLSWEVVVEARRCLVPPL